MIPLPITCYNYSGTVYVFRILGFLHFIFSALRCESLFFGFTELRHRLLLNLRFFPFSSSFFAFFEMARTKTTPNPPPSVNYQALYRWASEALLAETSQLNSHKDIDTYKQGESHNKFHVFRKKLDVYLKVLPCRKGVLKYMALNKRGGGVNCL